MMQLNQKGGFTMGGMLAGAVASLVLFVAMRSFFSLYQDNTLAMEGKSASERNIRFLKYLLERDLVTRYLPGGGESEPAVQLVSGEFSPEGCKGVEIVRRHLETNILERVRYETICRESSCVLKPGASFIRVTRWPDLTREENRVEDYPLISEKFMGSYLCIQRFLDEGGDEKELLASFSFFYSGPKQQLILSSKLDSRLPLDDRHAGVEFAP